MTVAVVSHATTPTLERHSPRAGAGRGSMAGQRAGLQQVANRALEHDRVAVPPATQLEQPGEVVVRVGDAGIERKGALVGRDRLGAPPLILDGNTPVEPDR